MASRKASKGKSKGKRKQPAGKTRKVARASTARAKPSAPAKRAPAAPGTDSRVAAAIALAIEDELASRQRARELQEPPSIWALTARVPQPIAPWKR